MLFIMSTGGAFYASFLKIARKNDANCISQKMEMRILSTYCYIPDQNEICSLDIEGSISVRFQNVFCFNSVSQNMCTNELFSHLE